MSGVWCPECGQDWFKSRAHTTKRTAEHLSLPLPPTTGNRSVADVKRAMIAGRLDRGDQTIPLTCQVCGYKWEIPADTARRAITD